MIFVLVIVGTGRGGNVTGGGAVPKPTDPSMWLRREQYQNQLILQCDWGEQYQNQLVLQCDWGGSGTKTNWSFNVTGGEQYQNQLVLLCDFRRWPSFCWPGKVFFSSWTWNGRRHLQRQHLFIRRKRERFVNTCRQKLNCLTIESCT